jgi:hypothetical protein
MDEPSPEDPLLTEEYAQGLLAAEQGESQGDEAILVF